MRRRLKGPEVWPSRLDAWLVSFLAALPRAEQRRWAPLYVQGLLLITSASAQLGPPEMGKVETGARARLAARIGNAPLR